MQNLTIHFQLCLFLFINNFINTGLFVHVLVEIHIQINLFICIALFTMQIVAKQLYTKLKFLHYTVRSINIGTSTQF